MAQPQANGRDPGGRHEAPPGGLFRAAYVDPKNMDALKSYAYRGVDHSFVSNYIMQPYWSRLVHLFPRWMAPNLITLIGLGFILANLATLVWFSPTLEPFNSNETEQCPPWVFYGFALGLFLYTSFDAVDGKQARRTGSSSPLGELFDHSCDSLSTVLLGVLVAYTTGFGRSWMMFIMVAVSAITFYAATWETFYTHTLYLGYINGPVDGTLSICLAFLLTGYFGRDMWLTPVPWLEKLNVPNTVLENAFTGWVVRDVLLRFFIVFCVFTVLGSINNVRVALGDVRKFGHALRGLFPVALWTAAAAAWVIYSPGDILHTRPLALVLAIGVEFAMLVARVLIAHLTHSPYPYFQPGLAYLSVATSAVAIPDVLGLYVLLRPPLLAPHEDRAVLAIYLLITLLTYLHMSLSVIHQFCLYLNIHCLRLGARKSQ